MLIMYCIKNVKSDNILTCFLQFADCLVELLSHFVKLQCLLCKSFVRTAPIKRRA